MLGAVVIELPVAFTGRTMLPTPVKSARSAGADVVVLVDPVVDSPGCDALSGLARACVLSNFASVSDVLIDGVAVRPVEAVGPTTAIVSAIVTPIIRAVELVFSTLMDAVSVSDSDNLIDVSVPRAGLNFRSDTES